MAKTEKKIRKRGGHALKEKYGSAYFSDLAKKKSEKYKKLEKFYDKNHKKAK